VLLNILLGECSLFEKLVNVHFQSSLLVFDHFIHPGLRETGLIRLVVSLLSITDNINDDICLELLSPISRELMDKSDSLRIFTIDVEDGTIVSLANVCSIWRGSCETGISRETDLIVD
jgi:hypothetical protein